MTASLEKKFTFKPENYIYAINRCIYMLQPK